MNKHFIRDLDSLTKRLLEIGRRCEDAYNIAIEAILSRHPKRAQLVVDGDREIDDLEVSLEEDALKILALHAPVAGDLRFLIAAIKINNDLERIADIAANIAKRAIDLAELPQMILPEHFETMATNTREMLDQAIRAVLSRDSDRALALILLDDEIDDLNRTILNDIEQRMVAEPEAVPALLRWANVARLVERIADYATNIAEDVVYMEKGEIVRHGS